ncbi:MAG: glycosyltransferase family 4 protein [Minisyncoccia bacterium]
MKKKILFIITKSNFGGAQKYVYDLATSMPKDKFDVAVALGGSGLLIQKLQEKGIRVLQISSLTRDLNTASDLSAFLELLSIFRNEKPDVVHLNSAKAGGVGTLAARLAHVPKIIFTAHGWAFNEERGRLQRIIIKFFSWITILLSHKTIAVSDAVKNDTKNWPLTNNKVVVIKNGIKEPEFYIKEIAREKLFALTNAIPMPDAFILGTIAELHKSKGIQYAIEAFAGIAQIDSRLHYFVLGGGDEKERLEGLVKHYGLQGRVFLVGFVEDAARFLPAFDVFILPSITEALGLVILEAGYAGLPVVASNVGGIPEIIEEGKTGMLIQPRDSKGLAEAIKKIFESPTIRTSLGMALREKIIGDFSQEKALSATLYLYEIL